MDKKDRIVDIVQARMRSTRLPGKVLMDIEGKPMLWRVVDRLKRSKRIHELAVATSTNASDDRIKKFCDENNIRCIRGSENDVLERYCEAAVACQADIVVRHTADCPLIDPCISDQVIDRHLASGADYTCNTYKKYTYPWGLNTEVISFDVLKKAHKEAKQPFDREHVTTYIYQHPAIFKIENLSYKKDLSNLRWTVDEEDDLTFVREVYRLIKKEMFTMPDVLDLLKKNPYLGSINRRVKATPRKSFQP